MCVLLIVRVYVYVNFLVQFLDIDIERCRFKRISITGAEPDVDSELEAKLTGEDHQMLVCLLS